MAQQGRSVWGLLIRNIINSLKPRKFNGTLVGKDHLGNSYYQILGSSNQKRQRWFTPNQKDDFEQDLPPEWESWLRYRRVEPPDESEVLANAALASKKKLDPNQIKSGKLDKNVQRQISSFPVYEEYEKVPGEKTKAK